MNCVGKLQLNTLSHFIYCVEVNHPFLVKELMKRKRLIIDPSPSFSHGTGRLVTIVCSLISRPTNPMLQRNINSIGPFINKFKILFGSSCTLDFKMSLGKASDVRITDHFNNIM